MSEPTTSSTSADDLDRWAESPLLAVAARIAMDQHAGQTDKAGEPYFGHPTRVAGKLEGEELIAVALLHDVLEDGDLGRDALFGALCQATDSEAAARIVGAVEALAHPKHEPLEEYYGRIRSNPLALQVKLADIHDNLEPSRLAKLTPEKRAGFLAKYGAAILALSK